MIKAIFWMILGAILYHYIDWSYTSEFFGHILIELSNK